MSKKKKQTFEALMGELEDVVAKLENDDLPLEAAIDAYQRGVQVAKEGHNRLSEAEQKIEVLTASGQARNVEVDKLLGDER